MLWRGERCFALLNATRTRPGHLMVLPHRAVAELERPRPPTSTPSCGRRSATRCAAVKAAYRRDGVNVGVNLGAAAGAGVPGPPPRALLPRWAGDANFMTAVAETRVLPEPLAATWAKLTAAWPAAGGGGPSGGLPAAGRAGAGRTAGWPYDLPAVTALGGIDLASPAIFLVGENGVGKSTLVEGLAMAAGLNPHGGTSNMRTRGHGTESPLHEHLQLRWGRRRPKRDFFLRAETLLDTVAAYEAIGGTYAGLTRLSHGESVTHARRAHGRTGLLLFADEPEDGLSVTGQLALLKRLHALVGRAPSS